MNLPDRLADIDDVTTLWIAGELSEIEAWELIQGIVCGEEGIVWQ